MRSPGRDYNDRDAERNQTEAHDGNAQNPRRVAGYGDEAPAAAVAAPACIAIAFVRPLVRLLVA